MLRISGKGHLYLIVWGALQNNTFVYKQFITDYMSWCIPAVRELFQLRLICTEECNVNFGFLPACNCNCLWHFFLGNICSENS